MTIPFNDFLRLHLKPQTAEVYRHYTGRYQKWCHAHNFQPTPFGTHTVEWLLSMNSTWAARAALNKLAEWDGCPPLPSNLTSICERPVNPSNITMTHAARTFLANLPPLLRSASHA